MFKEPGDSSPERVIAKVERTAASSRSAIRRERTVRETDTEISRQSGDRNGNHVRSGSPAGGRAINLRSQGRPRTQVIIGQAGGRDVSHPTPELWGSMLEAVRRRDQRGIRNAVRMQVDEELRQSSLSQTQRPSQSMTTTRQRAQVRTPWVNHSSLTRPSASIEPSVSAEEQVLLARPYMPSPPYSFSDNTATGLRPRGADGNIFAAEPTPGFAPARGLHRDNTGRESAVRSSAPRHHTPPGESSWTASYPPLRRVSHFSPRREPNSFSLTGRGGLGDRRRSVSSTSEAEHDTWETLLTTMEPDTHLPSTDSSFTSGTASQSTIRHQNTSFSRDTNFASATTATATQRFLSRPTSPTSRNPTNAGERDMDLEIESTQYEGLSEESRGSMRTMLDIIQNARQFRTNNPIGDVSDFLRPQPNERPSLASRRQRARQYLTVAELCHQDDENRILSTHLTALREMDELRATTNIRARRMANPNMATWQRAHRNTSSDIFNSTENVNNENENQQPRLAQDLLRTMEQQTRQIARELENMQENEPTPTTRAEQQSRASSPDSTTTSEEMENVQPASQHVASRAGLRTGYHAASRTGRR